MIRVLLIDDEEDVCEFAKSYLEEKGFSVDTATSAGVGFRLIEQNRPNLILLDVKLPGGMGGIGMLEKIKKSYPAIKVLIVTGMIDNELKKRAMNLGADGYLCKPLKLDELEQLILQHTKGTSQ